MNKSDPEWDFHCACKREVNGYIMVPDREEYEDWARRVLDPDDLTHGNCYEVNTDLFWKLVKIQPNLRLCLLRFKSGISHCVILDGNIVIDQSNKRIRKMPADIYFKSYDMEVLGHSVWFARDEDCPKSGHDCRMLVCDGTIRKYRNIPYPERVKLRYQEKGPPLLTKSYRELCALRMLNKM
jgi:hypothetical protein